jgi:hypothetical protein
MQQSPRSGGVFLGRQGFLGRERPHVRFDPRGLRNSPLRDRHIYRVVECPAAQEICGRVELTRGDEFVACPFG